MASVHDVAAYIREQQGCSRMKLLKLVYYAQAWNLVWDSRPLFEDDVIEAWAEGPVARALWSAEKHQGGSTGNASALDAAARATIDEVVRFYGRYDGDELSDLTHHETPWLAARAELPSSAPSRAVVTAQAMRDYYAALPTPHKRLAPELARGIDLLLSVPPDERATLLDDSDIDGDAFLQNLAGP